MKFIQYLSGQLKEENASNDVLLGKLKKLPSGKIQRFFDDWDKFDSGEHQQFLADFSKIILKKLEKKAGAASVFDAYQSLASRADTDKYGVFAILQEMDSLLVHSKEWENFWQDKDSLEDLKLQKNLLLAYRFSLLQSMYLKALESHPERASEIMANLKNIQKIMEEYQQHISTRDTLVENLDKHLQKKVKPTILSRAGVTDDPSKKQEIAANLKKVLETGKVKHSEKVADLMAQYHGALGVTKKQHKLGQYLKMAQEYYKTQEEVAKRKDLHRD